MVNGKKRRSDHRVLADAESFCETVRSLLGLSACDTGRITQKASPRRGVLLRPREYDIEAIVYVAEGKQRFYLKPANGITVEELRLAVKDRLERKYPILSKEVGKMPRERVTDSKDMEAAREVVRQMAVHRKEDGQYEVSGVFAALKEELGWTNRKATAAVGNLVSSHFLVKRGTTILNHRKTAIYLIPSMRLEGLGAPVPLEPSLTAESELASLLLKSPEVAEQIVNSLWTAKAERVETFKSEIAALEEQMDDIKRRIEERRTGVTSLEEETRQIEVIAERLHQRQP